MTSQFQISETVRPMTDMWRVTCGIYPSEEMWLPDEDDGYWQLFALPPHNTATPQNQRTGWQQVGFEVEGYGEGWQPIFKMTIEFARLRWGFLLDGSHDIRRFDASNYPTTRQPSDLTYFQLGKGKILTIEEPFVGQTLTLADDD